MSHSLLGIATNPPAVIKTFTKILPLPRLILPPPPLAHSASVEIRSRVTQNTQKYFNQVIAT